ncbi:MAG: glucokinase, partial [Solirubrobacteraceae bacterium]|nr:glucokinase [Solirubrobacteraceae bacterium]
VGGEDLAGVGIGVPSIVEFATGRVVASVNIPLKDVPLRSALGDRLGVPVFVDNDATVAALAEAHDEQLRLVAHNLVMLTVGTGVGGGVVLGGRIFRGSTGAAGELGHTIIGADLSTSVPEAGSFPQAGSLEALAAGLALDKLAARVAEEAPDSMLGHLGRPAHGADAVAAAKAGDEAAARIVRLWARRLGIGIANVINTFDPEEVVIGGGAAKAAELLLEPAREVAMQYLVPGLGTATTIRLAWHGVRAGVLGAALLAAHELEAAAGADRPATADADKPAVSHTDPTEVAR